LKAVREGFGMEGPNPVYRRQPGFAHAPFPGVVPADLQAEAFRMDAQGRCLRVSRRGHRAMANPESRESEGGRKREVRKKMGHVSAPSEERGKAPRRLEVFSIKAGEGLRKGGIIHDRRNWCRCPWGPWGPPRRTRKAGIGNPAGCWRWIPCGQQALESVCGPQGELGLSGLQELLQTRFQIVEGRSCRRVPVFIVLHLRAHGQVAVHDQTLNPASRLRVRKLLPYPCKRWPAVGFPHAYVNGVIAAGVWENFRTTRRS